VRSDVQQSAARNTVELYDARVRALTAQWQGYSARVGAESERVRAMVSQNNSLLERDRMLIQRDISLFQQTSEQFRSAVALYEATTRTNIERNKLATQQYDTIRSLAAEAAKVGAQVNAQIAAAGFSVARVNASQQVDYGVRFNYQGETTAPASPG
jgi:hypothetical protein